jgi:hypothetical protein
MSTVEDVHRILAEHGLTETEQLENFKAFVGNHKDIDGNLARLKVAELLKVGLVDLVRQRVPRIRKLQTGLRRYAEQKYVLIEKAVCDFRRKFGRT